MADPYQPLLEKAGLKWDDLTDGERLVLENLVVQAQDNAVRFDNFKEKLQALIDNVARNLSGVEAPKDIFSWLFRRKRDVYLKARLANYLLIRDVIYAPEQAKKLLENRLRALKPKE